MTWKWPWGSNGGGARALRHRPRHGWYGWLRGAERHELVVFQFAGRLPRNVERELQKRWTLRNLVEFLAHLAELHYSNPDVRRRLQTKVSLFVAFGMPSEQSERVQPPFSS